MAEDSSIPLASQVGGHAGVRSSADGSQIIKPCLPAERHFYETVVSKDHQGFKLLSKHLPKFYGVEPAPAGVEDAKDSLVLENLSHKFTKPNILDIKLGTVLYDEHATLEKKVRMIKSAKETTSFETGVRITGFQVYDTTTQQTINVPKDYGRHLKVSQLPEAAARFFPIRTPLVSLSSPTPTDESGQGHTDITPSPAGTSPKLLIPVLRGILGAVKEIREAIAMTEMRMVGGSILIIYEGDEQVLAKALAKLEESTLIQAEQLSETKDEGSATIVNVQVDAGAPPAYVVKVIDFAHTTLEEGLGQDEGVVLGLDNTIKLLEGRIKEAEEALGSATNIAE